MISKFINRLKLQVGTEAQIDEVEFYRRKSDKSKMGTEKNFFIDSICPETKFMLSSEYARTKIMRGFHGSIKSANAIMKGWEIYYTFIIKHQHFKCCPYELAIPELAQQLKEVKNRWLGLIRLSKSIIN